MITILVSITMGLLTFRFFYLLNLKLEQRYRIVEMESGMFVVQKLYLFRWKQAGYYFESHYSSLKYAHERVREIVDDIRKREKANTPVNYHYLKASEINKDKLLLKDLMSKLSTAVNNNNKEEEELIFNQIEKVLR